MGSGAATGFRGAPLSVFLMTIRFLKSVAGPRASFRAGQVVRVARLPKGWEAWLQAGVLTLEPEDAHEAAVVSVEAAEAAVKPRRTRKKAGAVDGRAQLAE